MRVKPLMIQGTMSGAGKSLLVAGFCRVLAQDGVRVAPFKSQNMALNSAVTRDGLEIGRAQALQAQAAGIEPTVDMNPILLKPTSDVGSQVIVRGKPLATMPAREYFRFKSGLKKTILQSYDTLARTHDVIIIEGAGSPVELNLKQDDIVNMGMAKLVSSPVLLVGDIDRGGVFAQLVGTMMLLEPDERELVKATVVNKFRGDASLFDTGLDILRERTGIPVAGLIPWMHLDLEDEDSMSDRLFRSKASALVDIAVIRLPKISNFTDFMALDALDDVCVRYVGTPSELGNPDLLILPGTKATMADLMWLRTNGLEAAILKAASSGLPVLGICGGYQMLGESISDPMGVEGGGALRGLGLLPVRTTFAGEKRTTHSQGAFLDVYGALAELSGVGVAGYEIHMGQTVRVGGEALMRLERPDEAPMEAGCQHGNVYGCYLHGLCDHAAVSQALVRALLRRKGLINVAAQAQDFASYREQQLDVLAEGIRKSMDMDLIYRIIEEGA
ncbi:MAG: cobyric acid synthase [Atopobiaceae bacterium]|nr:cobyric acid synthase [Atopobiaceae bacterium]